MKLRGIAIDIGGGKRHIWVKYHKTIVVEFNFDSFTLNSGGYRTATTKKRMNEVSQSFGLDFIVYQDRSVWYVDYRGHTFPFTDGMNVDRHMAKKGDYRG